MKTVKKTMILAFLFPVLMTVLAVSAVYTANASSGKMTITAIDLRGGNLGEAQKRNRPPRPDAGQSEAGS